MFHQKEVHSSGFSPLSQSEIASYRNDGITLVMRVFYLEDFVTSDISAQYLNYVQGDFDAARAAGVKLLVRFAYTQSTLSPYGDATPERVLAHISQLSGVLKANSDVIALVQAGFIGAWGEWFYTSNFSKNPGNIQDQNWIDRKAVIDALLNAISINRTVALRTPAYKRKLTGVTDPLTAEEAFSGSEQSRIGHHNDCFVASSNDVGTYVNVDDEKNYLQQDNLYVPIGGETCGVDVPLSECPNALAELRRLHWSYLNIDYHPSVIAGFISGNCLPDIKTNLGYRFRLTKTRAQENGRPGGTFDINVALVNDGFANPYNPRLVEVVLKNSTTGKEYFLKTIQDPRRWALTDTTKFNVSVGLPAGIENGSYKIYLNLPDPEGTLYGRPEYSIHLANPNVWDDLTGYNDLGQTIDVTNDAGLALYSGASFFVPRYPLDESLTASPLFVSSASNQTVLYWGLGATDPYRVIERSDDDGATFHQLDVIAGSQVYYRDKTVVAGTSYTYRYYFRADNAVSAYAAEASTSTTTVDPEYYTFKPDGDASEWKVVAPLASRFSGEDTYAFRLFASADSLNILIEGESYDGYALFLNSDDQTATGVQQSTWQASGFDFLLRNDSLYSANGNAWTFVKKITSSKSGRYREASIPFDVLNIGAANIIVKAGSLIKIGSETVSLPFSNLEPASYVRLLPSSVPSGLNITNSQTAPETRLVVQWSKCNNCNGMVLERSANSASGFEQLFKTNAAIIYRDEPLTVNTTYYYRMYSYNEIGKSGYSSVVSGTTIPAGVVTGVDDPDAGLSVYPNPVTDKLSIAQHDPWQVNVDWKIYNAVGNTADGSLISVEQKSDHEFVLDLSKLASGIYIIRIAEGASRHTFKIVKI